MHKEDTTMDVKQLRQELQKQIIDITPDANEDATYNLSIRMILDAQNALECDIYQLKYEMSEGEVTYSTHTIKWHTDNGARCTRHYNVYNA